MYSEQVLEHFQNPRGVGDLDGATVTVEAQNPACGDVMRLSLLIENGRVVEAKFRAKGCVPAIACGSRLVEMVRGMEIARVRELVRETLVEDLGGLPETSQHASYLAMEALGKALSVVAKHRDLREAEHTG
jgi:nitrogen fixation protein NifU and related proteins